MKTRFVCSILLFLASPQFYCSAQVLYYDVYKGDHPIGLMKINRIKTDSVTTHYKTETEVTFRILKEFKVESTFESIFQREQLTYGRTLNLLNGKERESSRVIWNGVEYICEREGKQKVVNQKITHSIAKLYFEEPLLTDSTFSERFIEKCFVEKTDTKGHYILHLPDGKENLYTYNNGICTEVKVDLFLATIYFKLSDKSPFTGAE